MPDDTTRLLLKACEGDEVARSALYDRIYGELRRLARQQLRRRWRSPTLDTTALVHETYVKLFDRSTPNVNGRAHFLALSSRAMRQVLVDHFRHHAAGKRGGLRPILSLEEQHIPIEDRGALIRAVDEAISRLEALNERLARVVEYRFFGGLTQEQIAETLGVTDRTVRNDWRKAKAWLTHELADLG